VFAAEHGLDLVVGERGEEGVAPVGEADEDVAGLFVFRDEPGVAEAGEEFVEVVPGDPAAVDGEVGGVDFAGADFGPELLSLGNGADVAIARGGLADGEFRDHVIEAAAELGVAGVGDYLREGGDDVAGGVAVEAGAFPVGVFGGFGFEADGRAERREKAIWR
jgi:hypothetical protein